MGPVTLIYSTDDKIINRLCHRGSLIGFWTVDGPDKRLINVLWQQVQIKGLFNLLFKSGIGLSRGLETMGPFHYMYVYTLREKSFNECG